MIEVGVAGALGRMGSRVRDAVASEKDMRLAELIDPRFSELGIPPAGKYQGSPAYSDIEEITEPVMHVLVDFTVRDAALRNVLWALGRGIHCVVGTTGLAEDDLARIDRKAREAGANAIVAPNFSMGAVLMMKFAELAAAVYDRCEIIELHHSAKVDAPSGTALATAKRVNEMLVQRGCDHRTAAEEAGSRGMAVGAVRIHSVRLDGLVAHQEVVFGSAGETLKVRHDTTDRSCFMPGVILAVRKIAGLPGLTVGIETLLGV